MRRRYRLKLRGSLGERLLFIVAFSIACFSVILLPFGVIMMIEAIEIHETY